MLEPRVTLGFGIETSALRVCLHHRETISQYRACPPVGHVPNLSRLCDTIERRAAQPTTRCGAPKATTSEAKLHSLLRYLVVLLNVRCSLAVLLSLRGLSSIVVSMCLSHETTLPCSLYMTSSLKVAFPVRHLLMSSRLSTTVASLVNDIAAL